MLQLAISALSSLFSRDDDLVVSSINPVENSFGIENTNGGAPDLHFYRANASGAPAGSGSLLGGIGARPWTGAAYTEHSTTGIHFLSADPISLTAQGSLTKIVATPSGATNASRVAAATFNGYGDILCAPYSYDCSPVSNDRGRGIQIVRESVPAETNLISAFGGYGAVFRGTLVGAGGKPSAPAATQAMQALAMAMQGHNGTAFTVAAALVSLRAPADWSATSTPTEIVFSTTPLGATARVERWVIGSAGNLAPVTDNTFSLGAPAQRVSAIYAASATITTSDAREKGQVRALSDAEYLAGLQLGRELGAWKFLAAIKDKGDAARWHFGQTVQRAIEILQGHGLDAAAYSCICHDEWKEGATTLDRYSFRTDELIMLMLAAQARRSDEIEKKLAGLTAHAA